MTAPARRAAYRVLRVVSGRRLDLSAALARVRGVLADERDRALATEIAAGTLRWRASLDWRLARVADRPLAELDPAIVDILRLSAYQILHLDRVPAAPVVSDAVDLARAAGLARAGGFVNAVLRRLARQGDAPSGPPRPSEDDLERRARVSGPVRDAALDYLSVTWSHPRWLAERWLDRHGFAAAERWVAFDNARAPLTLRANRLHIDRDTLAARLAADGIETVPTRFAPDGLVVVRGHPLRAPIAGEGLFVPQDEASQLVTAFAGAEPGERVLDACAAPGGKATAFAASVGPSGRLVALELRPRRVALLVQTLRASGASHARVVRADVGAGIPFGAVFDRVVVDAPCSGLGTLRRDPDVRWRRTAEDLGPLAHTQRRMLHEVARAVRPGGLLVYATCSSEPEENEAVVEAFLADHPHFSLPGPDTSDAHEALRPVIDDRGCLRTSPAAHGLEAFFAATMARTG